MYDRFSDGARSLMSRTRDQVVRLRHDAIEPVHMLLALAQDPDAEPVFSALAVDPAALARTIEAGLEPGTATHHGTQLPFTPSSKHVLEYTVEEAQQLGARTIVAPHLLLGLLREEGDPAARLLREEGVDLESARRVVTA